MDAELNTNVGFFGASLIGYPRVNQDSNYNNQVLIPDESEKTKYQHMPTDDLSHIWATNHRDNIEDLDAVLKTADINAMHDPEYYGAKNLDLVATASQDMWDFGKYLEPDQREGLSLRNLPRKHIDGLQNLPRKHIDGMESMEGYTPNPDYPGVAEEPEMTNTAAPADSELQKEHCYPLWMILVAIVVAIFSGAYFLADMFKSKVVSTVVQVPIQAPIQQ